MRAYISKSEHFFSFSRERNLNTLSDLLHIEIRSRTSLRYSHLLLNLLAWNGHSSSRIEESEGKSSNIIMLSAYGLCPVSSELWCYVIGRRLLSDTMPMLSSCKTNRPTFGVSVCYSCLAVMLSSVSSLPL